MRWAAQCACLGLLLSPVSAAEPSDPPWLAPAREAVDSGDAGAIRAALRKASDAGGADAASFLAQTAATSGEYALRCEAVAALGALADEEAVGWLSERIRTEGASWRLETIDAAGTRPEEPVREALLLALEDAEWRVRVAAMGALARQKWIEAVPALTARLRAEQGRPRLDAARALTAITGEHRGTVPESWEVWWETRAEGGAPRPPLPVGEAVETPLYYSLPVQSRHALFLVDFSSSMRYQGASEDRDHLDTTRRGDGPGTRCARAKEELRRTLGRLPSDTRFNIAFFGSQVSIWSPAPRLATAANLREAQRAVDRRCADAERGTLMYEALREGLAQEVDTIYLMSDGVPEGGEVDRLASPYGPGRFLAILDRLALWNASRRVEIHCVGLHLDPPGTPAAAESPAARFLRAVAARNGGIYLPVSE